MEYKNKITVTQEELNSNNGDTIFVLDKQKESFIELFPNCEIVQIVMNRISTYEFELTTTYNIIE